MLSKRGVTIDHALLVPGRFIVGRTTDNDMQIDSKFVSRHHMQLVTSVDNCYVEDLNSTNGVFLNGKRVRRHKLQAGDVIKLGMHEITYSPVDLPFEPGDRQLTQRGRRCCRIPTWIPIRMPMTMSDDRRRRAGRIVLFVDCARVVTRRVAR